MVPLRGVHLQLALALATYIAILRTEIHHLVYTHAYTHIALPPPRSFPQARLRAGRRTITQNPQSGEKVEEMERL